MLSVLLTQLNSMAVGDGYNDLVCVCVCLCCLAYEPPTAAQTHREPAWQGRSIGTTKLRLVEFSSFLETQRDQEAVSMTHTEQQSTISTPYCPLNTDDG